MDNKLHDGHRERMRTRINNDGIESLQPHEVLEYILYAFVPRKDTNLLAHKLIQRFGSLSGVFDASVEELSTIEGISYVTATFIHSLAGISNYYQKDKTKHFEKLDTLEKVTKYMCKLAGYETKEKLYLLMFNSRVQLIKTEIISKGTVNKVNLYTREIAELALRYKATGVMLCHNHPSGNITPSFTDKEVTQRLYTSLRMINIKLLDHIIVYGDTYYSMKFAGDFKEIIDTVENKLGENFF